MASQATVPPIGSKAKATAMPAIEAVRTSLNPNRSAIQPPNGEKAAPTTVATPSTRPTDPATSSEVWSTWWMSKVM